MQHAINVKEKNKIVSPFHFLLPITAGILVCVLYLCYEPGVQDTKTPIDVINQTNGEDDSQENFEEGIEEIKVLENSVGHTVTNRQSINLKIESKLKELSGIKQRNNSEYKKLNSVVLEALVQLHSAKKEIVTFKEQVRNIKQLQEDLNTCKNYIARPKTQFDARHFPKTRPIVN
ncbi:MAG: hypothetical protein ABIN97_07015 [Ginsengibacter sp.]